MHFGEHLTIDGYKGSKDKLNDREYILSILNDLPVYLGMKPLSQPQVFYAKSNNKKDPGGWSGFVVIQESHISIHTFPNRGFLSSDVYTCKNNLDKQSIISYFKDKFLLEEVETNFIIRGKKYPVNNIYQEKIL